jgi:hypothetical protein
MLKLTQTAFEKAKTFITEYARPLERAVFSYYFGEGTAEGIFAGLAEFQNGDGGFGHGLEPDVRLPDSSAMATTIGLQMLREFEASEDRELVKGAMRYLLNTYDEESQAWLSVPASVSEYPRAPWWEYDDDPSKCLANPRAEIVGYLLDYASLVPGVFRTALLNAVVSHLDDIIDGIEMDELLCYVRLVETQALPEDIRGEMLPKLKAAVDRVVVKEPDKWSGYGLKPLMVVSSPDSPFAEVLAEDIQANLDYEIQQQTEEGSWTPNWGWADFPDVWRKAEQEWKGVITVANLKALQNFGRIE